MNEDVPILLTKLYRSHFAKLLSALMHHTGIRDISLAEDIVQEAFAVAAEKWKKQLPDQPEAWLFKTIRNIAYNTLKKEGKKQAFETEYEITANDIKDEQLLKVLFICVRSSFSAKIQLVVALRYVNGLQVKRIAALLGTTEDHISKILYRWRAQCKAQPWNFEQEIDFRQVKQVRMVLQIIYVMFTEGYRVSAKTELADKALCEDALSLLQSLIQLKVSLNGEVKALYALLLYHLARACSRLNELDELVELAQQDRSCWNKKMITVANNYLLASKREAKTVSAYQIEAIIAHLHTTATAFNTIKWLQIAQLYKQLQQLNSSPFIKLNYAVALYFAGQLEPAVQVLGALGSNPFFSSHYLLHCFWAKVHHDKHHFTQALTCYQRALQASSEDLVKQLIKKKMLALSHLN